VRTLPGNNLLQLRQAGAAAGAGGGFGAEGVDGVDAFFADSVAQGVVTHLFAGAHQFALALLLIRFTA